MAFCDFSIALSKLPLPALRVLSLLMLKSGIISM